MERIQNAEFRRILFRRKIGAGLTMELFQQKLEPVVLKAAPGLRTMADIETIAYFE